MPAQRNAVKPFTARETMDRLAYARVIALRNRAARAERLYTLFCRQSRANETTIKLARILIARNAAHIRAARAYIDQYGSAYVY